MIYQERVHIKTPGQGTTDITEQINEIVETSNILTGTCHLFMHHTSASIIVCENWDPTVRDDLETFAGDFAKEGDPRFVHQAEGPDDMPAHIRTIFTHTDLTIPICEGKLGLGTWQGLFIWEHRKQAHRRQITATLMGELYTS